MEPPMHLRQLRASAKRFFTARSFMILLMAIPDMLLARIEQPIPVCVLTELANRKRAPCKFPGQAYSIYFSSERKGLTPTLTTFLQRFIVHKSPRGLYNSEIIQKTNFDRRKNIMRNVATSIVECSETT